MSKQGCKNLIVIFVLCVAFLAVSVFSACKKGVVETSIPSESSSSTTSSSSDPISTLEEVDRSNYTIETLSLLFKDYNTTDFLSAIDSDTLLKDAKGFMLGDIFNSLVVEANETFPSGSDITKLVGFKYLSDGNWYNNSTNLRTHKVMNALLNYKLDGSEKLAITKEDIASYGDNKLVDFTGYTKSVIELVNAINPLVYYLINSTFEQWVVALEGDNLSQRILTFYDMVGDATIKDALKLCNSNISVNVDVLIKDVIWGLTVYRAIGKDYVKLLATDIWRNSEGTENAILQSKFTYNSVEYSVNSAIDHLLCKNEAYSSIKEIIKTDDLIEYIKGLQDALESLFGAELNALVEEYVDNFLNNPDSGEQTIEDISSAINLSQSQKETAVAYCFDILAYFDTVYGQDIEVDGLTLSDVILYINEFFAGQNTYNSLTVKELVAFFTNLNENNLNAFATDSIKQNQQFITSEIETYKTLNPEKNVTLTFESLLLLSQNPETQTNLTQDDIDLLNAITLEKMIVQNGVVIKETQVSGVDEFIDGLMSVNLYEMIYNLSDSRFENLKSLAGNINVFGAINLIFNE